MSTILRIAISVPLRQLFDYLPPIEPPALTLEPGMRVLVPFGRRQTVGIIVEVSDHTDHPLEKLKKIVLCLDQEPLFPKTILSLIQWASRYYQGALGEVFETAIPKKLRQVPKNFSPQEIRHNTEKKTPQKSKTKSITPPLSTVSSDLKLNSAQEKAINSITQHFGQFKTFVLDGVTGSGKTEVYLRVVAKALQAGKQALLLVPEIGLTPQLLSRFQERFSVPIAALNSSLTDKQRALAFENARTGLAPIVIGTRLAAFVPLKNPGVLIIDEEHDASFKQQEGFRYHARDLLILRGSLEHCPVVLGSATASLETLHNIQMGRFYRLSLPHRAGNAIFPTLQILDVRHKKCIEGLSSELIAAMQKQLAHKAQVLLFLNRRGYAPVLMCFTCDWVATCKNCDAKMTLHQRSETLQCHHCDLTISVYTACPCCKTKNPKPVGIGTERLEAALQAHFPTESIVRIDRDTTRKKGELKKAIDLIHSGEANILIGTQMIAKGHHFPNVTLVGILDIDHALFSTDFRSIEKMGQLITQVAGRSGRAERPGHVILQTCHPEHPLLKQLLEKGYSEFSNSLLTERKMTNLPPYSYQVLIRAEAVLLEKAIAFLSFVKKEALLKSVPTLTIAGPISAPMERRLGKHRAQLLFQSPERSTLQRLLQRLVPKIESNMIVNTVKWSLDVDPIDMY